MRAETRAFVDEWWAEMFGCARADLRQGVHVAPHALLGDYAGLWVVWRDTGVHVSTPSSVDRDEADSLATQGFESLTDPDSWSAYAAARGWALVAAACLTDFGGEPRDIGMVVALDGRGLGRRVGGLAVRPAR